MANYNKSLFDGVPNKSVNKSRFNLSHEYKAQLMPGYLYPVMTIETLPGDEFTWDAEFMFRFAPLYYPVMHKMTMRADLFFVSNRILWTFKDNDVDSGWQKWIMNMNEQAHPTVDLYLGTLDGDSPNYNVGTYMGLPLIQQALTPPQSWDAVITDLNAFPLSAYLKIWDEYYRNPQLEEEKWFPLEQGDNTSNFDAAWPAAPISAGAYSVFPSKWEMDYFTSALPTPQIGDAITVPINGIDEDGNINPIRLQTTDGSPISETKPLETSSNPDAGVVNVDGDPVSFVEQATIRDLRLAEVLQSFYERLMKTIGNYGRYWDYLKGLWAKDPMPNEIDRPVLISSRFGLVQISDVLTSAYTNGNAETAPTWQTGDYVGQANLYERGGDIAHYTCNEHGFLMCILQVNPNTSYGQGIERFWRRSLQTEYPMDMFASIGDQEILKEEVLYNAIAADVARNKETFGYIPRFSEMRYKNNMQVGKMNTEGSGLSMHIGRRWFPGDYTGADYSEQIVISKDFVQTTPSTDSDFDNNGVIRFTDIWRALPVNPQIDGGQAYYPNQSIIYAHIFHSLFVNRQLPMFSTPNIQ